MGKTQISQFVASSSDPEQLSLTVRGALIAIVPIIGLIINAVGGSIDQKQLNELVDLVSQIVIAVGGLLSLLTMAYGAIRRVYNSIKG
jgi:hypothetical protein